MSVKLSRSKSLRTTAVVLCCGGLLGALPVAAATAAAKTKTPTTTFDGTARKN